MYEKWIIMWKRNESHEKNHVKNESNEKWMNHVKNIVEKMSHVEINELWENKSQVKKMIHVEMTESYAKSYVKNESNEK